MVKRRLKSRVYKIPKGRNNVLRWPHKYRGCVEYLIALNESAIYEHRNVDGSVHEDQKDFNKLIGAKKDFFFPREQSIMAGWRWSIEKELFELTPYIHKGDLRFFGDPIITSEVGEKFRVRIDLADNLFMIVTKSGIIHYRPNFLWTDGWMIFHQFGGQQRSKQCIKTPFERIL